MTVLKADRISKCFTNPTTVKLFHSICLEVMPAQSIAIVGKSGRGKSTLLHILGTLELPTAGELFIMGQSTKGLTDPSLLRNRHIGFIFQAFHLLEDRTVLDNVLLPALIAKENTNKKSRAWRRAHLLLEKVGLTDRASFSAAYLSGGEKQRIAIARALIQNPDLIIADEPTGNLDHTHADHIAHLLFDCVKEEKKALIVATHSTELSGRADLAYCLDQGQLNPINPPDIG